MGNRKEQIQDLEREINQKQQIISELKAAEQRQEPEELSEEEIKKVVDNLGF